MERRRGGLIRLTGLWRGETRDGAPMLHGALNRTCRLVILRNDRKASENEPDYVAFLAPVEREEEETRDDAFDEVPF